MQAASDSGEQSPRRSVGIRELKAKASEIVREVHESGVPVDITVRGEVVARLTPTPSPSAKLQRRMTAQERVGFWKRWDALAEEIGSSWPEGVSAVDAVREQRREL
jgi:prevent-host-death family protein